MKYVFVGDIHGRWELVEKALAREGKKVFVGDFMDSFNRSPADMGKCLALVLAAIENGEAEAIYGNHDLAYIMSRHRCSGNTHENRMVFQLYQQRIMEVFKPHLIIDKNVLVTHAGLTKQIWDAGKLTLSNMDKKLTAWWPKDISPASPVHWVGRYRGGWDSVGGTFWCDWNGEFEPIPKLIQVFGHTAGNGIRRKEDSYCIDCLEREESFLEMDL